MVSKDTGVPGARRNEMSCDEILKVLLGTLLLGICWVFVGYLLVTHLVSRLASALYTRRGDPKTTAGVHRLRPDSEIRKYHINERLRRK